MDVFIDNKTGIAFRELRVGSMFVWNDKLYAKVDHSAYENAVQIGGSKSSTFANKTRVLKVTSVHVTI
ncbi:hypothetical protein vBValCWD615_15 [Vibrio phage vB_ValC_WD615]|nr:hypothetical protein vBValCWD615_15 [Vibrio phage vB_ValC_WD615]